MWITNPRAGETLEQLKSVWIKFLEPEGSEVRLPPLFLRKGDCRERSSWEGMHIQIFGSRFSDFSRHMLYTLTSVAQLCPTLCDPIDCSMPGFPVHHQLLELAQTHVHRVSDAIQSSRPLLSPSPPVFNLSQHQGLFQ